MFELFDTIYTKSKGKPITVNPEIQLVIKRVLFSTPPSLYA